MLFFTYLVFIYLSTCFRNSRCLSRKKGAKNERDENIKIADTTTAEMVSSGGRAPPATAEAETAAAKRPSPQPARKARKVATTESTAAVAPGPSTPGSSRARGRRCGKCGGCARCERYDGCMLTQLYCISLQKWKWPVMHIGSLCCFTFSPSLLCVGFLVLQL